MPAFERLRKLLLGWLKPESTPNEILRLALIQDQERHAWESVANRMRGELMEHRARAAQYETANLERAAELIEARAMSGSGPWLVHESRQELARTNKLRESNPLVSQGAYGDIELALQNVEWRREVNLSWIEFSRWGIQQIILICRLNYIKNPLIRRGINITAQYVFGRGFEASSSDPDANDQIQRFMARNKATLGQSALMEKQRQKTYDGNVFWVLFPDATDTGEMEVRYLDATEVFDVVTDPDDTERPWFYRRKWTARRFDVVSGQVSMEPKEVWYPSLDIVEDPKPGEPTKVTREIDGHPVMWDNPVLHRKVGHVANWHFGCPPIYPALDWAKESLRFLQACANVAQALSQIAQTITTKGGQQAIEGMKQQLQTNVGPQSSLWDNNPPAGQGSTFISGPGTALKALQTRGAGQNPEEVRRFIHMVAIVFGLPETFFADASTGSLATAQSLDRPTELCMLEAQEQWREDLVRIITFALKTSAGATKGRLREAMDRRNVQDKVIVMEAPRTRLPNGDIRYEAAKPDKRPQELDVRVSFPPIREGDLPELTKAIVEAITLGSADGQDHGIDIKTGVRMLLQLHAVENADDLIEEMFPEGEYDPDRTQEEEEPAPVAQPGAPVQMKPGQQKTIEAVARLIEATGKLRNGTTG